MDSVVVATNNQGKIPEITQNLNMDGWHYHTLMELGIYKVPEEDGKTYEDNARIKAQAARVEVLSKAAVARAMQLAQTVPRVAKVIPAAQSAAFLKLAAGPMAYLADDSGLEVDALDGAPGVISARYAGEHSTDAANVDKLLKELEAVPETQRTARFMCTMVYITQDGQELVSQGSCEGRIAFAPRGDGGFGYDPIFIPDDIDDGRTMAELTPQEKDGISHRGRALRALREKLLVHYGLGASMDEDVLQERIHEERAGCQ